MVPLGARAERQIAELRDGYEQKARPEAIRKLIEAVIRASERVETKPDAGLPAPRPYPELAREGERWIKEGRYWIVYSVIPLVILGVFYDQADLVNRA